MAEDVVPSLRGACGKVPRIVDNAAAWDDATGGLTCGRRRRGASPLMHACRPLLAVLAALVLLGACSRGDDEAKPKTTTSTTVPDPKVTLTVTDVQSNGTAPPSPEIVEAILATLDHYLADGVVAPLQTGVVGSDLDVIFSESAAARLDGDDREALVDEHLPRLPRVRAQRANVSLSTLAGPDGQIGVIAAHLDLAIRATGKKDDLDITHVGDFVLVPDAAGWKIDSYNVHTTRDRHPEPTTTTQRKKKEDDE